MDPPEAGDRFARPSSLGTREGGDEEEISVAGVFEMEGLVTAADPRPLAASSVGAGKQLRLRTAPLVAACSPGGNPRIRTLLCVGLLLLALLCATELVEDGDDARRWRGGFFGRRTPKRGAGQSQSEADPLSALSPDQRLSLLKEVYGAWTFYDGSAEERPAEPYMTAAAAGNPYLDLPEEKFPPEAWQADAVYANHFIDAAIKLVERAQQALFSTYHGHGLSNVALVEDGDDGEVDYLYTMEDPSGRIAKRMEMFRLAEIDLATITSAQELLSAEPLWQKTGGWTTLRSFKGLQRRLTHAMMTNSDFVVVVAGGWRGMGYGGNHAAQSMPGVFETLLRGVFAKLGVTLVVRAIALPPLPDLGVAGGTSTLVHTLGWSSIYGSDVDMVVWDDYAGAAEDGAESAQDLDETSAQFFDLFCRQALLSGTTSVPFIWGGSFEVLRNLHEHADVDVGQLGNGFVGVPETTDEKTARTLPWAARYLNCPNNMQNACQKEEHQFESKCWIHQSDVTPPTPQLDHIPVVDGAIGWRMQQLKGYVLSYQLLQATLGALSEWSETTISQGFPLPDECWHVGETFRSVQQKVKALDEAVAPHCFQALTMMNLPKRLCRHRMKGRTEFTPRANPAETSLRTLLGPTQIANQPQFFYERDDPDNPVSEMPGGEIDALEVLELQGRRLRQTMNVTGIVSHSKYSARYRQRREQTKQQGEGWQLLHGYGDECDGSLSSSTKCGRLPSSSCLMEGHQGSRGGIWGNETTDWLVLSGFSAENGFVALNFEIGGREQTQRALIESIPDAFELEYAIGDATEDSVGNAAVTALDKTQLLQKLQQAVPGMSLLVVVDDDESSKSKNMTVAVRAKGCADKVECQFALTHVYWS